MDSQRELLDQLMGKNRNLSYKEQIKKQEKYYDDKICKSMLISECLLELFPKTSYYEGPCNKRHEPIFKHLFENDESYQRYKLERKYINDALQYMEDRVKDVDEKIKNKQASLANNQNQAELERPKEIQERIDQLDEDIRILLDQSSKLGEEGQLEESEQKANEAEIKTKLKEDTIKQAEVMVQGMSTQQCVCDVCGAYQAADEQDKRRLVHLEGKIHQGFKFFREEIVRLKERKEIVRQKEEETRKLEGSRSRSRSRGDRRSKKSKKTSKKHKKRKYSSDSSSERDRKKKKRKHRRDSSSRSKSRSRN